MTIKYSIVIPTRNRAEYLTYAIQSVLESSRTDIELIVSNNFSNDETTEILSKISDPRLRVISPSVSLPMAGHYEFAISQATGEWITILGDDDAVLPYIYEILDKYIEEYPKIDIISSVRAYYFWEGCEDLYGNTVIGYSSSPNSQVRSTKKDLYAVLKGYRSCFDMPQIYTTSIIKRSLYEEIKDRSGGCFYHSIIPDMYSVVALSLARDEYLRLDESLFWVGTSNKSMGRSNRIYRDAEQFSGDPSGEHTCVPRAISDKVSYQLHSSAFSPMYIYECLLQSPLSSKEHRGKKVRADVLAAVLNDSKKRGQAEREQLFKEIWEDADRHGISRSRIMMLTYLIWASSVTIKFRSLLGRIIRRLAVSRNTIWFRTTDRSIFPTILDASRRIMQLRSAEAKSKS